VQTTSTIVFKIVKKEVSILILIIKTSVIKLAKRYYSRVRNVTMYALEITMLNSNKSKNIFIRYKLLFANAFYLF